MKKNSHAVFTVCNLAYLPKALVLAESLLKHDGMKLRIYLIDRKVNVDLPLDLANSIWIEDEAIPDIHELAFKYDITEFSTSVKPWLALKLLEQFENVIFLDPDTCLYASIEPILKDLDQHPIVLTPHYVTPQSDSLPDSDLGMMRFGSFNLGFFAVKGAGQGLDFLKWWSDRCLRFCYFETQFGLSTDQKWVSIAPCFFSELHVSFNLGYNVAFWNVHERSLTKRVDGTYWVNEKFPLIFFHFSSFNVAMPELLSTRNFPGQEERGGDFYALSLQYKDALARFTTPASAIPYGFDFMSDGMYISPTLRRAYACVAKDFQAGHDPFDSDGPVGVFAKKNYLLDKKAKGYKAAGFADVGKNRTQFAVVNFLMRIILRAIGPNRFANLSRLFVYLSSYRLNRGLWKF
jgi:hypothetical protein